MPVNQAERAFRAWNALVQVAANENNISYVELAELLSLEHHRPLRFVLALIQDYCLQLHFPPLTILVANKQTGQPGEGFIAFDPANLDAGRKLVYDFPWGEHQNPFWFATQGMTEESLINQVLQGPDDARMAYNAIADRGSAQIIFRRSLISAYNCQCAICGIGLIELLEASHIIPWSVATDEQKMDVRNGILMCANHHRLFDRSFLYVDEEYLIGSSEHSFAKRQITPEDRVVLTAFHRKRLKLPRQEKHWPNQAYLGKRREKIVGHAA